MSDFEGLELSQERREELLRWFFANHWGIILKNVRIKMLEIGDAYVVDGPYDGQNTFVYCDVEGPFVTAWSEAGFPSLLLGCVFAANTTIPYQLMQFTAEIMHGMET